MKSSVIAYIIYYNEAKISKTNALAAANIYLRDIAAAGVASDTLQ